MNVHARSDLHQEIATLRAKLDEAREALRQAEQIWAPLDNPTPRSWLLRRADRRVLASLMRRSPHGVSTDALLCAAAGVSDPPERGRNLVSVYVGHIRSALAAHVPGGSVETVWGEGYRMSAASKALIEAAIEAAR